MATLAGVGPEGRFPRATDRGKADAEILLVGHDVAEFELLRSALRPLSLRIGEATSILDAQHRAASMTVAAIIAHVSVLAELPWAVDLAWIPVLVFGGRPGYSDAASRLLGRGVVDWLGEEEAPGELRRRVEYWAERFQGARASRQRQVEIELRCLRLEQRNEELQQLAFAAAHDLNAPVRQIRQFVGLALRRMGGEPDGEVLHWLSRASETALYATQMVEGTLELAGLGQCGAVLESCRALEVIESARQALASEFEQRGVNLCVEALPDLWGSRIQLVRLFQNLFENALRYAGSKALRLEIRALEIPALEVPAGSAERRVRIQLSDNGIGIAAEDRERVFECYQRGTAAHACTGVGLGLSLCRKIVASTGGQIRIAEGVGPGCCVEFDLPVAPDPSRPLEEKRSEAADPLGQSLRVLIVGDVPEERTRIREALVEAGFRADVREAPDGYAALEVCQSHCFDCVLIESVLPDLSGEEVCRRIVEQEPGARVLLMQTGDRTARVQDRSPGRLRERLLRALEAGSRDPSGAC